MLSNLELINSPNCFFSEKQLLIESQFSWSKISEFEFIFTSVHSYLIPLKVIWLTEKTENHEFLKAQSSLKLNKKILFIIPESSSNCVLPLMMAGAFDVVIEPLRFSEFHGKLNYYFSHLFQAYLFNNSVQLNLNFTIKEQKLFDFLLSHPQGVMRNELMDQCWSNCSVHPKTLDVHIFNLRKKLETVGVVIHFRNGLWIIDVSKLVDN